MEYNRELRERLEKVEQSLLSRSRAELRSAAQVVEEIAWREFGGGGSPRVEHAVDGARHPPDILLGILLCRTAARHKWNRADQAEVSRMVHTFRQQRLA